jgi:hypothetical protein
MRIVLDFHGSEVRDMVADGDSVRVRFSAATVRADDGERGWLSPVVLTLARATLAGDPAHAFGKITEGALRQDGRDVPDLALPAMLAGTLELTLRLANGTLLAARGRTLTLAAADGARFTQDLSC